VVCVNILSITIQITLKYMTRQHNLRTFKVSTLVYGGHVVHITTYGVEQSCTLHTGLESLHLKLMVVDVDGTMCLKVIRTEVKSDIHDVQLFESHARRMRIKRVLKSCTDNLRKLRATLPKLIARVHTSGGDATYGLLSSIHTQRNHDNRIRDLRKSVPLCTTHTETITKYSIVLQDGVVSYVDDLKYPLLWCTRGVRVQEQLVVDTSKKETTIQWHITNGELVVFGGLGTGLQCEPTVELHECEFGRWSEGILDTKLRYDAGTATVGRHTYIMGGFEGEKSELTYSMDMINHVDGSIVVRSPLLQRRSSFGVACEGTNIYVAGGLGPFVLNSVECFNTVTNEWKHCSHMRHPRSGLGLASLGGKIYACGGNVNHNRLDVVESYDIQTDEWCDVTPLPHALTDVGVVSCGDRLYVMGGRGGGESRSDMFSYDPDTKEWRIEPPMYHPRYNMSVVCVDDVFYALGGADDTSFALGVVEAFDTVLCEWTILQSMSCNRTLMSVFHRPNVECNIDNVNHLESHSD
jgi:N-acetylneuraminic acid mutarotase